MKWLNREEGAYLTGVMSYTIVFFREGQWVGFTTSGSEAALARRSRGCSKRPFDY